MPGGSIWFTEFGADKIGSINPSTDAIAEYPIPSVGAEPFRIALGPDGNLWFTEIGTDQIGKINPNTGKITEYSIPTPDAMPFGIAAGPNNTVWFTEWSGNQIGSINTKTGKITEYTIPTANAVPEGITVDQSGNVWFTESQTDQLGRFDPATNAFVEHPLPTMGAEPYGITQSGGNLYFTEYIGNQVGVYNLKSSTFSKFFTIPTADTEPTEITAAPDGKIWFTQSNTNQVARLSPATGAVTEFTPPSPMSGPRGITVASDGSIWFAELNSGKIATITLHMTVTNTPPLAIELGQNFGLSVAIEDDSGAVDTGFEGSVTLATPGDPAAGVLAGTTSVQAVNGIATFTGLSLVAAGSYSIQVTSGAAAPATVGPIVVMDAISVPPLIPSVTASKAPVVLGEQLVTAGKGKNKYVSGIVITFSSALDPATAQNASNFTVIQTTKGRRASAAKAIRLHARYKPASNTVKLTLLGRPRFAAGGQLVLNAANPGGLASPAGVALEGNSGVSPGSNGLYEILPNGRGMAN